MKLENELNLEDDVGEPESYSENIKDYLENSPYEVKDVAGQEEVVLTRKYNNEKYAPLGIFAAARDKLTFS